jgi:hypothetical protein
VLGDFEVAAPGADGGPVVTDIDAGGDAGETPCPPKTVRRGDQCVSTCQPGGNECGAHGKCAEIPGGITCNCDPEYTGSACNVCKVGYQDNDGNGSCLPTCATVTNLVCTPPMICGDATGVAQCTCPVGYTLDTTPTCVWTGVVHDPGFTGTPANAWSVQPNGTGITFDTNASLSGMQDRGYAHIDGATMCSSNNNNGPPPRVFQQFDMPTATQSGPMSLTVSASASYPNGDYAGGSVSLGPNMGQGGGGFYLQIGPSDTFTTQKFCLGERQYGKGQRLEVGLYAGTFGNMNNACTTTVGVQGLIDRVDIAPDPTCPTVGKVFNGDFESGASGWVPNGYSGDAAVMAGVGANGTYGGRLQSSTQCDYAYLQGSLSAPIPTTMPNLGLRFNFKGSGGGQFAQISVNGPLGGGFIASGLMGSPTFTSVTVCLPEWAKGNAESITLTMPQSVAGCTGSPDGRSFVFDDLELVSEPSCPAQAFILDGDFEGNPAGSAWAWAFSPNTQNGTTGGVLYSGGTHYGSTSATKFCGDPYNHAYDGTVQQMISMPQNMPQNSSYKVQFSYRTTETNLGGTFSYSTQYNTEISLPSTGGMWQSATACINPYNSGPATQLTFRAKAKGGVNCGDTMTTQTLDIDNVVGTVVTTCP